MKYYITEEETVLGLEYWLYKRRWWWFDKLIATDYSKLYLVKMMEQLEAEDR